LLTRLSHSLPGRAARPGVLGAVLLTAALATAGCGTSSSSSGSGTSQNTSHSAFRQCLEAHGVTLPQRRPSAGTGVPHPRPTGSAAGSFRQALQACGGSFPGHDGASG
jgi:hypothetical protein